MFCCPNEVSVNDKSMYSGNMIEEVSNRHLQIRITQNMSACARRLVFLLQVVFMHDKCNFAKIKYFTCMTRVVQSCLYVDVDQARESVHHSRTKLNGAIERTIEITLNGITF